MSVWTVEWTDKKPMKKTFRGRLAQYDAEKFWRYVVKYHDGKKKVTIKEWVDGKVHMYWSNNGGSK